jgi:hypothetical protein
VNQPLAGGWKVVFLMDVSPPFPYLSGLLNRMTHPAIAAATLLIRVKNNCQAGEGRLFPICH